MQEKDCMLCKPDLAPIIAEGVHWRLVLNHSQRFLGACFWALRRHCESITELSPEEWAELQNLLIKTTMALKTSFQPDHFNYVFLQNQDKHVHMHLYPRYASPRSFIGLEFTDPDYPSHYSVPAPSRFLEKEQLAEITAALQKHYQSGVSS